LGGSGGGCGAVVDSALAVLFDAAVESGGRDTGSGAAVGAASWLHTPTQDTLNINITPSSNISTLASTLVAH